MPQSPRSLQSKRQRIQFKLRQSAPTERDFGFVALEIKVLFILLYYRYSHFLCCCDRCLTNSNLRDLSHLTVDKEIQSVVSEAWWQKHKVTCYFGSVRIRKRQILMLTIFYFLIWGSSPGNGAVTFNKDLPTVKSFWKYRHRCTQGCFLGTSKSHKVDSKDQSSNYYCSKQPRTCCLWCYHDWEGPCASTCCLGSHVPGYLVSLMPKEVVQISPMLGVLCDRSNFTCCPGTLMATLVPS